MTRRAARIDRNQPEIVDALRRTGVSVETLAAVGEGVPDLLCALANDQTFLLEVKDGSKPASERKLTKDQVIWHARWRGRVHVVTSVDEALAVAAHYRARPSAWPAEAPAQQAENIYARNESR